MSPPRGNVLVGVEFAAECGPALRWAWQQAAALGRDLDVATVWEFPRVPPEVGGVRLHGFGSPEERERAVAAALERVVAAAGLPVAHDAPALHLHPVRPHSVGEVAVRASLLVLPGEPHDADTDYLTGPVRRSLAAACRCPVVLVSADGGADLVLDLRDDHRAELTRS